MHCAVCDIMSWENQQQEFYLRDSFAYIVLHNIAMECVRNSSRSKMGICTIVVNSRLNTKEQPHTQKKHFMQWQKNEQKNNNNNNRNRKRRPVFLKVHAHKYLLNADATVSIWLFLLRLSSNSTVAALKGSVHRGFTSHKEAPFSIILPTHISKFANECFKASMSVMKLASSMNEKYTQKNP